MLSLKVLVVSLCSGLVIGFSTSTSGTGGTGLCGDGPNCISPKAVCTAGDCVCQPPFVYHNYSGRLDCFRGNTVWGRGVMDPTYKTFDEPPKFYKYVLPCRVLISHTITQMKARVGGVKQPVGTCNCKVYSWNAKYEDKGKIYPGGVDVTCMLNHNTSTTLPSAFTIRIAGTADSGTYNFEEWGSLIYNDPNPSASPQVSINTDNIEIESQYDTDNNVAYLDVKACGVRVGYTPYDKGLPANNQTYLPGFTCGINCAHQPEFESQTKVMFTGPEHFGVPSFTLPAGMNRDTFFLKRALTSGIAQTQPNATDQCEETSLYNSCTNAQWTMVYERCIFLFTYPLLANCIDDTISATPLMTLFNQCMRTYCEGAPCATFSSDLDAAADDCSSSHLPPEYNKHFNGDWCTYTPS